MPSRLPARRRTALLRAILCTLLVVTWTTPFPVRADGFADLRAALARAAATTPVKGTFKAETTSRQGDDKDTDDDRGEATVDFDDGPRGLRVSYPRELLARVDHEVQAKEKDAKAKTPATSGMRVADPASLRTMLSPVPALQALLDDCAPKGEVPDSSKGPSTRRLSCEHNLSKLKGRDRKYAKTHDGKVDVWIGADNLPVATSVDTKTTGRAYVVISFETASHFEQTFRTVGDRLVSVREERRSSGAGAGEKGEGRTVRELVLAP